MKKFFALILLIFAIVACTGIEQVDPIDEPDGPKTYTMTVKAAKDVDTKALALSLDGTKLNALWAENDAVKVYKGTTDIGTLYAQNLTDGDKFCTLKGTLNSAPADGETLTLKYHSDIYTGQDGTLDHIAGNCDYAEASVTVKVDGCDVTTTAPAAFVNKQAIVKFTFKDSADPSGNTLLSPSVIEVEASSATFSEDYSFDIPSTTYTTNGAGIIYLAFPDVPADYASLKSSIAFNIKATVGANTYTFTKKGFPFENGKYFDITVKMAEVIGGKFSVSPAKQVYFSKGNLRANYNNSAWSWSFAPNQWSTVGNSSANTNITGNGQVDVGGFLYVDLFGWSTTETHLGIHKSTTNTDYQKPSVTDGTDFVDWGSAPEVTACIGSGWYTLKGGEWDYLFNSRSTTSGSRFCKAKVGDHFGIILLPDDWKSSYYDLQNCDEKTARNFDDTNIKNKISYDDWGNIFEANGAVFLPCAGQRSGIAVSAPNGQVHYWSSTGGLNTNGVPIANHARADGTGVAPNTGAGRSNGFSVRLVRDAN